MPRIPEFEAPRLGLTPSDRGVQGALNAARRIGRTYDEGAAAADRVAAGVRRIGSETEQLGRQTAQEGVAFANNLGQGVKDVGAVLTDYADHQQIQAGAAHGAQLFNNLNDGMQQAIKSVDPNDPAYGPKVEAAIKQWREQSVEPALDQFKEGFTTENSQRWAEQFVDRTRQHMFISSSAEVSSAANIGIKNAIRTTVNEGSTAVNKDPTPGTIQTQFDLLDHSVTGMVSTSPVKGAAAASLRSEVLTESKEKIFKSAVFGYIQKTGQMPSWASDPAYAPYSSGTELKTFQQYANAQQRANAYYERQTALVEKQQADLKVHKDTTDLITKGVSVDPTNPNRLVIAPDFMKRALDIAAKNPDAPSAASTVRTVIDWAQQQQRTRAEPVLSDPATKSGLITRLFDQNKPLTEFDVMRAEADDKLSTRDGQLLRGMVKELGPEISKDPVLHATIDAAKERVGETVLADGHERFANFMQSFLPEYLRQKRAGTLEPNALDLKDKNSLISKSIAAWEPSAQEKMMGTMMKRFGLGGDMTQHPLTVLNPDVKPAPKGPAPGLIQDGYKFKGGDPSKPENWEKVK